MQLRRRISVRQPREPILLSSRPTAVALREEQPDVRQKVKVVVVLGAGGSPLKLPR